MKNLLLPSSIIVLICFLFGCSASKTGSSNTVVQDTLGIAINTSGINRSVPPPVGQNHPLGSVGLGSKDMMGTAAITELNQDKVLNQDINSESSKNLGLAKWEAANMSVSDFVNFAYQSGLMEIASGKLARKKASVNEVKNYAATLITDYSTATKELEKIAKEKNIKLTSGKRSLEALENAEGMQFDEQFISRIIEDYRTKIAMYEKASSFSDKRISTFSQKQLPILKNQLAKALILK